MRRLSPLVLVATIVIGAACSESPTAPPPAPLSPKQPDLSVITPILLPPGAAWGLYFTSFNTNRNLTVDAIHYYNGTTRGKGSFVVPGVGIGALYVTRADAYGGCVPNGTGMPCDPNNNKNEGVKGVPESAWVYGVAFLTNGVRKLFKVDLHSNFWPNPTNQFDTADLYFCTSFSYATCTLVSHFYGELHHEPQ